MLHCSSNSLDVMQFRSIGASAACGGCGAVLTLHTLNRTVRVYLLRAEWLVYAMWLPLSSLADETSQSPLRATSTSRSRAAAMPSCNGTGAQNVA